MMRYRLTTPFGDVTVSLDADDANARTALLYDGDGEGIRMAREWLRRQYGAFGHGIGDATSPVDLHAAMAGEEATMFAPELVEGAHLVSSYDPQTDEGAVT